MKNSFSFKVLSKEEEYTIYQTSLDILEKIGVKFYHGKALKVLGEGGAIIDLKDKLVKIPIDVTKDYLQKVPREFKLYFQNLKKCINVNFENTHFGTGGCCTWIYDFTRGKRHKATLNDLRETTIVADLLEDIVHVNPCIIPTDVHPSLVQIKQAEMLLKYCNKVILPEIVNLYEAKTIFEMAEVVSGGTEVLRKKPILLVRMCPESPLAFSRDVIDVLWESAKLGLPTGISSCPICGLSAPITLPGALSQMVAENLAVIIFLKMIDQKLPVIASTCPFLFNLREGNLICASPELMLLNMGVIQIFRNIGIPFRSNSSVTDAKFPNIQAGYEQGIGLITDILSGPSLSHVTGVLDDSVTFAIEDQVISVELLKMMEIITERFNVTKDELAVETIKNVEHEGNFLKEPHTFKHAHNVKSLKNLDLLFRGSWATIEKKGKHDNSIFEEARSKTKRLLSGYESDLPKNIEKQLTKIVDKAVKKASNVIS